MNFSVNVPEAMKLIEARLDELARFYEKEKKDRANYMVKWNRIGWLRKRWTFDEAYAWVERHRTEEMVRLCYGREAWLRTRDIVSSLPPQTMVEFKFNWEGYLTLDR